MILKILLVIIGVFLGLVGSGFCQSAKARDTITMTLEDYEHIGAVFNSLPIRERHKNLKKQDVVLYRCPKCGNYIKEWTEVCECGKVRTYMLIMTKDREILNLDNVLEIRAIEENVECELMNGYIYTIQSFKTHKKAEDALDKILNQYDRGQSVIKL